MQDGKFVRSKAGALITRVVKKISIESNWNAARATAHWGDAFRKNDEREDGGGGKEEGRGEWEKRRFGNPAKLSFDHPWRRIGPSHAIQKSCRQQVSSTRNRAALSIGNSVTASKVYVCEVYFDELVTKYSSYVFVGCRKWFFFFYFINALKNKVCRCESILSSLLFKILSFRHYWYKCCRVSLES